MQSVLETESGDGGRALSRSLMVPIFMLYIFSHNLRKLQKLLPHKCFSRANLWLHSSNSRDPCVADLLISVFIYTNVSPAHNLFSMSSDKSSTRCGMEKLRAVEHILVCAELLHQYLTHVTYVVFRRLEMWQGPGLCVSLCVLSVRSPHSYLSVCLYICLSVSIPGFNHVDANVLHLFTSHFTPFRKP